MRINKSQLKQMVKKIINESDYHSPSDYEGKWYEYMKGTQFLHKYPQDFIDWMNEEDTWAETYARKYRINKIIDLFELWVNESY